MSQKSFIIDCIKYRNFTYFLVLKFCGKAQFLQSFVRITRNSVETVPFRKIYTLGN